MKIESATRNERTREVELVAAGRAWSFPYAKLRLQPTGDDPIAELFIDPELGCEAFTYQLRSGAEDTIHMDAVREVNRDPEYLQDLAMHLLTVEAVEAVEESGLGMRQIARLLGTSPTQLYRLLDTTNAKKSLGQMLQLLHLVNREVKITVEPVGG